MKLMSGTALMIGLGPCGRASMAGSEPGARAGATAVSILVHAGLIGALWLLAVHMPRPLQPPAAMTIVFEAQEPPGPAQALSAATLAAQNSTVPASLTGTLPSLMVKATVKPGRPLAPAASPARATPALRTAAAAPPPIASLGPAAQATQPDVSQSDIAGLKLRIREAVRSAAVYPAVARQMHREGRAQVSFEYVDGAAEAVSLAHSSQSRLLDEAALAAVRRAAYPHPLPGMAGMRLSLMVWVNFGLEKED
jgi:TonB family protein